MHTKSVKQSFSQKILSTLLQNIQQAAASLSDIWRTPIAAFLTMLVLGVSLALPTSLYIVLKNTQAASENWSTPAEINLFLKKEMSETRYQNLLKRLNNYKEIEHVKYISKAEGMANFSQTSGFNSALKFLDKNPLPAVVVVTPKPYYRTAIAARELLVKLEREAEVKQGKLDITWLSRLDGIIELFSDAVWVLSVLLLSAVLLITGNTIRLNILSQRAEIEVMKLVGATNSFIQRPFLYTGFWYGIIGGLLAWLVSSLMVFWIEGAVLNLTQLYHADFTIEGLMFSEAVILLLAAIAMGLSSAAMSVNYYVAKIEPS